MTARLDNACETISASFFPIRGRPQTLGVVHPYAGGDQIYAEGDPAHSFYTVISGAVRTVRHSPDGRRQIGDFYYAGDLFGFEANEERLFTAEAMRSTRVRAIRLEAATTRAIIATARQELSRAHEHQAMLGRRSAEEKVASFLLELAREGPIDRVALPMSRQDMADYLGLALETVSRVLSRFHEGDVIGFVSCREFRILKHSRLLRLASA